MKIRKPIQQGTALVPCRTKGENSLKKIGSIAGKVLLALLLILLLLAVFGTAAHAAGLVDDTVDAANEYSKYPLDNYQLDFYVDSGWDWLPWNWLDGIGKQVMYGLYAITNFIWTISLYLSNATGYLIQEAYSLDFISSTADSIGKNMQTLAGVTTGGLSSEGFYVGFLLILILVVGIYVAYTGLIKRETTKAIHAVVNFVVVFVLSAAFIAYAPDYIGKINEFSADISNASLTLGTKIVLPNSESQGKDSVDLIRDSLFSIQVKQPWLLLQYGNSDVESIGADRVESLLSTSPDENNGQDREEIVVEEIEDRENTNLTITKTINRLGTVFFLFMFNIGISVFVFLLTGIMIFSQVLFIIYAMFLPVSFLLSMVVILDVMMPGMDGFETLEEIRKENSLPILMFTSKNDSASKVRGLRAGADDYLTKPFDMDELIARIISLIRRYTRFNQTDGMTQQLEFDGLKIDLENRSIITENGTFELPPKEFDLLLYCAKHQGKILTKQQIYEEVWGEEYVYDDSNIMAIISRLRKKLEVNPGNPKYIQTIKGIGYRFSKEV